MKKVLSVILIGMLLLPTSVCAEKEYQFDIIFIPNHPADYFIFDGQNVITYSRYNHNKTTVYNQKLEKIGELNHNISASPEPDNEKNRTISVSKDGNTMVLGLDTNDVYLNGEAIHLDVPAQIIDGRVLVPYEAVAVALGADWDWDQSNETLTLFLG